MQPQHLFFETNPGGHNVRVLYSSTVADTKTYLCDTCGYCYFVYFPGDTYFCYKTKKTVVVEKFPSWEECIMDKVLV